MPAGNALPRMHFPVMLGGRWHSCMHCAAEAPVPRHLCWVGMQTGERAAVVPAGLGWRGLARAPAHRCPRQTDTQKLNTNPQSGYPIARERGGVGHRSSLA